MSGAEPSPVGLDLDTIEATAQGWMQRRGDNGEGMTFRPSAVLALCAEVRRLRALKVTDDGAYQHVVEMFHNDRAELERLQAVVDGPFVDARTELEVANSEIERLRAELRAKPYAMAFNRTELAEQVATLRAERDALRDQRDRLAEVLTWLDRLGGLGLTKHERITAVLAEVSEGENIPAHGDTCS